MYTLLLVMYTHVHTNPMHTHSVPDVDTRGKGIVFVLDLL